jgi:hypothetical protein
VIDLAADKQHTGALGQHSAGLKAELAALHTQVGCVDGWYLDPVIESPAAPNMLT